MNRHGWTFQRICALALLVLAASPLTAPFSSGHPLDLLGDAAAHIQSKKAPDDPIVTLASPLVAGTTLSLVATEITRLVSGQPRGVDALLLPLRI